MRLNLSFRNGTSKGFAGSVCPARTFWDGNGEQKKSCQDERENYCLYVICVYRTYNHARIWDQSGQITATSRVARYHIKASPNDLEAIHQGKQQGRQSSWWSLASCLKEYIYIIIYYVCIYIYIYIHFIYTYIVFQVLTYF